MIDFIAQTAPGTAAAASSASPIIWAFVFIAIAIVLFFIEIFVPSGGLIALLGALSVVASLIAFFMHDANTGLIAVGAYIVFGPVLIWITFRIWVASPLASRMVLGGIVVEDEYEAKQRSTARQKEQRAHLESFIGKQGTAITVLRPVGVVRIDGERIDAMAETGSIEADSAIEVTSVYDNQVKVRTVNSQE
jgi:membrane-bound serine protease (ClpP class)